MTVSISIWSDIACPWCFVGKQRLEAALKQLHGEAIEVDIRWRAFELDPRPTQKDATPYAERLAKKYGRSVGQAQQMLDTMTGAIKDAGGECDFNRVQIANTFDAHRLIQWAGFTDREGTTVGAQQKVTDALMRGYLGQGLDLSSHTAMAKLIADLGLDDAAAADVLAGQAFAETVRNDEQLAQQQGISGVPFFVIGRYGVSGAQEASTLVEVIRDVQKEQGKGADTEQKPSDDAPACDAQGCD